MLGIDWKPDPAAVAASATPDSESGIFDVVCERELIDVLNQDGCETYLPGIMKVTGRARVDTRTAYRLYAAREATIIGPSRIGMDVSVVGVSHGEAPASLAVVEWVMSTTPGNWGSWLMDGISGTLRIVPTG